MAEYINPPMTTDPVELAELGFQYLRDNISGWNNAPANLETLLLEGVALLASEVRDVAVDVPTSIFRYFGAKIVGIVPDEAEPATATSTWTMRDNAGYTIPAGTLVGIPGSDPTDLFAFEVATDVVVAPGSTTTAVGEVALTAVEPGAGSNDAVGAPQLITALDYVSSIAIVAAPDGGVDDEEDQTYLDRLASELQLLSPRPILPEDFAVLARRVSGVYRAVAVDGLIPGATPETGNERAIAIAAIDENGVMVSAGVRTAIEDLLEGERETTFVVNAIDPKTTTVDVDFAAVAEPGWDPADVEARAEAAVASYLSPASWGVPSTDDRGWVLTDKVRIGELYAVLSRVAGLDYVTSLILRRILGSVTFTAATDLITTTGSHGLAVNDPVVFTSMTGGAGITSGATYYVKTVPSSTTFTVAASVGGAVVNITSDGTGTGKTLQDGNDENLPGYAPLPTPGTIAGTVTA